MATCRTFTSAVALLVCTATAFAQAPANDNCANATVAALGNNAVDSTGATDDGLDLDPLVCDLGFGNNSIFQDVWFSFTPGTTDIYDIEITNNGGTYDSRIAIYNQSTCPDDPANVIDCDDDGGPGTLSSMFGVPLTSGVTYLIRCGTFSAGTIPAATDLSITVAPPPPPAPANDDCANAIAAGVGLTAFDSSAATDGAGLALDPVVCDMGAFGDEQIYQDVWYTFTAPATDFYDMAVVNNGNTSFDSRIAVYDQSTCPDDPANVIACDDDDGPGTEALVTSVNVMMGQTVIVRVGSFSATTVEQPAALSITIGVPPPAAPANDDCANATLAMLGANALSSVGATDDGMDLDPLVCDLGFSNDSIFQDVWYLFTPATTDVYNIDVTNNGGTYDSRLAVYNQSTCPDDPANVIDCDDDDGPGTQASIQSLALTAGTTYLIRVGTFAATTIPVPTTLDISVAPPPPTPPANDDCVNATPITMHGSYAFDNGAATTDGPDLAGLCDFGLGDDMHHADVWFEYTPTVGGCTYISTLNNAGFDSRISIFTTSTCPADAATILACSDEEVQPIAPPFEAGMDVQLSAGTTYLINVGNFSDATVGGPGMLVIGAGPVAVNNDGGAQTGAPGCPPGPVFPSSCNGDGGDQMGCTPCPCGNEAMAGTIGGCLNSSGNATAIAATGDTSVSLPSGDTTDLRLTLSGAPSGAFCVMLSGGGVAPAGMANPCFGLNSGVQSADRDGLRCAVGGGQALLRHGGRSANASGEVMDSSGPSRVWGGEAQPAAGIAGQAGFTAGQTRHFQVTHREDALAVCMRGLNTSQALQVTFTP